MEKPKQKTQQDKKAHKKPADKKDDGIMAEHIAKDGDEPIRQRLKSDEGMAYYGTMHVGGQPQVSIYDTGSFDIVLTSSCSEDEEKTIMKAKEELMSKSKSSGSSGSLGGFGGNMSDIFGMKKG